MVYTDTFYPVLLRLLQTFSGVAFLSTNRVGAFDSSFLSHVNFSLYFPQLGQDQKQAVWEIFRRRAEADFHVDDLEDFSTALFTSRTDMNGREIRNMWQTAMSLALFEHQTRFEQQSMGGDISLRLKPLLREGHFEKIEQSAAQFRSYLTAAMGERGIDPTFNIGKKLTIRQEKPKE